MTNDDSLVIRHFGTNCERVSRSSPRHITQLQGNSQVLLASDRDRLSLQLVVMAENNQAESRTGVQFIFDTVIDHRDVPLQ
jgi:hypothetical protein